MLVLSFLVKWSKCQHQPALGCWGGRTFRWPCTVVILGGAGERWFPEVKETPPFHSEVGSGEWGGSCDGIWEIRLCGN